MKRIIVVFALVGAIFLTGYDTCQDNNTNGKDQIYTKMHATAYCLQGKTYTGKKVRKGIAATGDKSLLGLTVLVYQRLPNDELGDLLYILEVEDSGCSSGVLDIWQPDLDSCQELMNEVYKDDCHGRVYCRFIDAKG